MVVASNTDWALGFTSRRPTEVLWGVVVASCESAEYTVALEQLDKGRASDKMLLKRGLMELEKNGGTEGCAWRRKVELKI